MDNRRKRWQQRGYALVACLGVVAITAILVLMIFSFTEATQQAATKRQYQDRGEEQIEAELSALHRAIEANLRANAQVAISALSSDSGQSTGDLKDGMYNVTMAARGSQSVIEATETHYSRSQLSDGDDPFRGATASTIEIDVTGTANRLGVTKPNLYQPRATRLQPDRSLPRRTGLNGTWQRLTRDFTCFHDCRPLHRSLATRSCSLYVLPNPGRN